jgi:predicted helicase
LRSSDNHHPAPQLYFLSVGKAARRGRSGAEGPAAQTRGARGMAKQATLDAQIDAYYNTLDELAKQYARHEGAVSVAFQTLLADTARRHHWTLIPQLSAKGIRPDGTLKDPMGLVRGHWEAKDTDDRLDVEIAKKIQKGYPLGNIIFEDTRAAVLIQNKTEVMRIELRDRQQLGRLLQAFFDYVEPQIESFEKAVDEFKERVPDIAKHLKEKIVDAHAGNRKFKEAYASFIEMCRTALNPGIQQDAVDDMLVQHLLTERLIREIFDNPEFTRRNVIAVEIEKVIDALTSKSFDRHVFLKSLDRFYVAIENAARTITEWSDKQHFLNTVYERFFQGYSVKLADTMGIVYTPQPIVDFMCASVAEVLEKEFGKSLGDKDVNILDPCTGTGNFIVNLIRRIPKKDLKRVYSKQLFANEIMLLPYYIAALNIEHAYYEQTGEYEAFEGLCFVDTLDLAESRQGTLSFMTEKNTERVERQKKTPITVIIGNPPYNANQSSENDNNKNRKYSVVDSRISDTYVSASSARKTKLYDAYVRFFRWASDRLGGRDGIVCFVTNNSFVYQSAVDGLQRVLPRDFNLIYHLDLRGNVRHNPTLSGTAYNVFGIQVGVGITLAIRNSRLQKRAVRFHAVDLALRREQKLKWLADAQRASNVSWSLLKPSRDGLWIQPAQQSTFEGFVPLASKEAKAVSGRQRVEAIFRAFSLGISTNRDDVVYDFDASRLATSVGSFCEVYNSEMDRYRRQGSVVDIDKFIDHSRTKWSRNLKRSLRSLNAILFDMKHIRETLYRPFSSRFVYFSPIAVDELGQFPRFFPKDDRAANSVVAVTAPGSEKPFLTMLASSVCDLHLVGAGAGAQCFPFYVYDADGTNRRENITDWALAQFRTHYKDKKIGKWDIFHYVYGVLHHPGYREKFADNLKRELPRIPFAPGFRAFAKAGAKLARLHLDYETLEPWKLRWIETPGVPLSYRVEKMKLSKDKTTLTVNPSLTLAGIPPETSEYHLGNRSALEWVIDQYQVSEDKRSGIKSDPNREEDEQYIVRLVGQVVRVSVETVKIVKGLPDAFA